MEETIKQRIAKFRKFSGYTQTEVAKSLGIKTSTYSQKERKGIIDCQTLIRLSNLFHVDTKILLFGGEYPKDDSLTIDQLSKKEIDLITMYRNMSSSKKNVLFEFAYYTFKN